MIKQYLEVLPTFVMIAALAGGLSAFANDLKGHQAAGEHGGARGAAVAAPSEPSSAR